jgi:hypothetical protein
MPGGSKAGARPASFVGLKDATISVNPSSANTTVFDHFIPEFGVFLLGLIV